MPSGAVRSVLCKVVYIELHTASWDFTAGVQQCSQSTTDLFIFD